MFVWAFAVVSTIICNRYSTSLYESWDWEWSHSMVELVCHHLKRLHFVCFVAITVISWVLQKYCNGIWRSCRHALQWQMISFNADHNGWIHAFWVHTLQSVASTHHASIVIDSPLCSVIQWHDVSTLILANVLFTTSSPSWMPSVAYSCVFVHVHASSCRDCTMELLRCMYYTIWVRVHAL